MELFRRKRNVQASAKGTQARVELLPVGLIGQELLELLHVLLVSDLLEQVPQLIVELRQLADFLPDVVQRAGKVILIEPFECAVGCQRLVEFARASPHNR